MIQTSHYDSTFLYLPLKDRKYNSLLWYSSQHITYEDRGGKTEYYYICPRLLRERKGEKNS